MTDTDFLERTLSDGMWHSHSEILSRSMLERGVGLTIHSRASDLRKRGHRVEVELRRVSGRAVSFYRCVLDEAVQTVGAVRDGSQSPAASSSTSPNPVALLGDSTTADADTGRDGDVLVFDEHDQARIFVCDIDESAGLRGAYGDAA